MAEDSFAPGRVVCAALIGVLLLPAAVCADDTDDIIAAITRDTPNRAEAAKKLLGAAKALPDSPDVQVRLCVKAYEQGVAFPAGYATAIAALDLLDKLAPARSDTWQAKRLEVYRLRYYRSTRDTKATNGWHYVKLVLARAEAAAGAGDWKAAATYYRQAYSVARALNMPQKQAIYDDLKKAGSYEMVLNRIRVLKAALAKDPDDQAGRRQLVKTYLVDLDRPHEAVKYLSPKIDATLSKNLTMATREASELADADFLALGQWYRSLAGRAPLKHVKVAMLTRALDNLKRYLEVYTKQDTERLRATTLVTLVEAELKKLGAGAVTFAPGIVLALSFEAGQWTKARDGSVTVKDVSGRTAGGVLRATVNRGKLGVPGKAGRGLSLPAGSRAYLDIPAKATVGLRTFTFAFWVKTTESGGGESYWRRPTLLGLATGAYGSRDYGITTSRGLVGYWSGLAPMRDSKHLSDSIRINDGKWHHVAMTNDGKTLLLYVDARAVRPDGLPTGQTLTTMTVPLGASRGDASGQPTYFHHSGTYDEFQLYNRALTPVEIAGISGLELASTTAPKTKTKTDPQTTVRPAPPAVSMWAAAASGNIEAIKQHVAAGTDVNGYFIKAGSPGSGGTALHIAAGTGQTAAAKLLIENGANVNVRARDKHGGTPLHWAAATGNIQTAGMLIRAGADINARDNNGSTPLDVSGVLGGLTPEERAAARELLRRLGARRRGDRR